MCPHEKAAQHTVRFRLKYPEGSLLLNLASPWNWIYKADLLSKDIHWVDGLSPG